MVQTKVKAFKELIAALGGEENIIEFGKTTLGGKKTISFHLRRTDVIQHDAFIFFNNVYCLLQSQGVSFEYFDSQKMEDFLKFLFEYHKDKYSGSIRKTKVLIAKKLKKEMAIPPRIPLKDINDDSMDGKNFDDEDFDDEGPEIEEGDDFLEE